MEFKYIQEALGLESEPPESFNANIYKKLYLDNQEYFNIGTEHIDQKYIMYHHYLHYGKSYGYSCNHNPFVFFHIPKSGGTYIHYGVVLPSLYRQYCINNNYVYNIDWLDDTGYKLYTTISYSHDSKLCDKYHPNNTDILNANKPIRIRLMLDSINQDCVLSMSHILCVIVNSSGFKNSDTYINSFLKSYPIYDRYIVIREPQILQESMFYYLRDFGTWEKTYGAFKGMSFSDYIHSDHFMDNWLIRQMLSLKSSDIVTDLDAEQCRIELSKFTQIGFLEQLNNFTEYLCDKYNWDYSTVSQNKLNENKKSKKTRLSQKDTLLLQTKVSYEKQIYDYFLTRPKSDIHSHNITNLVLCYFKNLNNNFSKESAQLIDLWKKSWSDNGWTPIVLTEEDVLNHPYYDENLWSHESNLIINCNPNNPEYIKVCYQRWFAYDYMAQKYGILHWADYDVINYGYRFSEITSHKPCRLDPSYCCGILNPNKSLEIINTIIKYAYCDRSEFINLDLNDNNDMVLLDKCRCLELSHKCTSPLSSKTAPDYRIANLVHFHGGLINKHIDNIDLNNKTRLQIIESLRKYE